LGIGLYSFFSRGRGTLYLTNFVQTRGRRLVCGLLGSDSRNFLLNIPKHLALGFCIGGGVIRSPFLMPSRIFDTLLGNVLPDLALINIGLGQALPHGLFEFLTGCGLPTQALGHLFARNIVDVPAILNSAVARFGRQTKFLTAVQAGGTLFRNVRRLRRNPAHGTASC
jgi:hypothetical protein